MSVVITRIGNTVDLLGESPVWDERNDAIFWIDALAGIVRRHNLGEGTTRQFVVPGPIGSMAMTDDGDVILALKDDFAFLELSTGKITPVGKLGVDRPEVRLNDGKVDRSGRFVVGTMQSDRLPGVKIEGGIFRLEPNGTILRLDDGLAVANGPCFSPDGSTMYIADSPARVMWAYDYDCEGQLRNKRLFVDTTSLNSGIDGATVDADGFVWGVLVRTGQIARLTPDGRIDCVIEVPVTHPTSIAFGGDNLDLLFLTSISKSTHLSAREPEAGGIFVIEGLGARGLVADRFMTRRPCGLS